ncbi:citryl-CoA lyase [Pedococcus sp. 5OH_020]|uniref:citryl-CoA lyase n=1 Tax=Pedococcus sp. 5OH_020 TaxID=2989814 RepID=UPI0022E9F138|nr:citryl-CoA lyase [Pedococcus sp. 5OH_020]
MYDAPYWATHVSTVSDDKVSIRGYDLESILGAGLPFTAATYLLIRGRLPTPSQVRTLDAALSAVLDFGLEKPGTVAARFAVSANPSVPAGLAAACLSVGAHTLATEGTGRYVADLHRRFQDSGEDLGRFADAEVRRLRAEGERIPGLGHPVFKRVDPRAAALKKVAAAEGCWPQAGATYEAVHASFTAIPGKADICINDVGVLAVVLLGLGFTPEEGTGLAILSTLPGVIAHISEELADGRRIRVVPRADVAYDPACTRDIDADRALAGWAADWTPVAESVTPA